MNKRDLEKRVYILQRYIEHFAHYPHCRAWNILMGEECDCGFPGAIKEEIDWYTENGVDSHWAFDDTLKGKQHEQD